MTVTQRKPQEQPEELHLLNEPGIQYECDSCSCDLTHSVRIKCADPLCQTEDGVDICPKCFCEGKEFKNHKRGHSYRVIELNSYPIFSDDWGADEELLLVKGIASQGFGNWKKIAEHIGTWTKEKVEEHYNKVYVDSPSWPLPRTDLEFDIDPVEFQRRKRRRIEDMNNAPQPLPKPAPVSLPGIHEVATFLPGRLEFEHELDNEAEDLVKDLEIGMCMHYDGDKIPEDENDQDVKGRAKIEEDRKAALNGPPQEDRVPNKLKSPPNGKKVVNGDTVNGHHRRRSSLNGGPVIKSEDVIMINGTRDAKSSKDKDKDKEKDKDKDDKEEEEAEEITLPPPYETQDSLNYKLTLVETYLQRVDKRLEAKQFMFDRQLTDYKKMQAAEKKRPREERDILNRLRPYARLQTAHDYEVFCRDILYEATLRKRIAELQKWRKNGIQTAADIEKYDRDVEKRQTTKAVAPREYYTSGRLQHRAGGRQSTDPDPRRASMTSFGGSEDGNDREETPAVGVDALGQPGRKLPPLNLANSPSLHLLTPGEQVLCSQLRILPKPYLVIKETLVREYARRGGKLRRREARDLVKCDVNKTSKVWDFLVQTGFLKINLDVPPPIPGAAPGQPSRVSSVDGGAPSMASGSGSPMKDIQPTSTSVSSTPRLPSLPLSSTSSPLIQNTLPSLPNMAPPAWQPS